jgi:colanic acid/amylovoran biosynthesis glycosyltransferase
VTPRVVQFRSTLPRPSEPFLLTPLRHFERWRPILTALQIEGSTGRVNEWERLAYSDFGSANVINRILWRFGKYPAQVVEHLRRANVQVFHAHFGDDGAMSQPVARALNVPFLVSFYGHDLTRLPTWRTIRPSWVNYKLRFESLKHQTSLALACCQFLAERLRALGWADSKIRVHYLGVEIPDTPSWRRESRIVMAVGRFVVKKGFSTLLEALAQLREQGRPVRAVLVGDGPLHEQLERQIRRSNLSDVVTLTGWLEPGALTQLYSEAAVFVSPSQRGPDGDMEGLPLVLVEAASHGVPLIGTRHAGIPEIVRDGVTGLLVSERDPSGLAQAIRRMMETVELRERCGAAARRLTQAQFSARAQARELEAIYDEVATHLPGHQY